MPSKRQSISTSRRGGNRRSTGTSARSRISALSNASFRETRSRSVSPSSQKQRRSASSCHRVWVVFTRSADELRRLPEEVDAYAGMSAADLLIALPLEVPAVRYRQQK